jgi:hypothetical protein
MSNDTWVVRAGMANETRNYLYLASFNFALTTLTGNVAGNVNPRTELELIFTMVWILVGITFLTFIMSLLISTLSATSVR